MKKFILASTSTFRASLLTKLLPEFACIAPDCDESAITAHSFEQTAIQRAIAKTRSLTEQYADAYIIGSDQVAVVENKPLSKPNTADRAIRQLSDCQSKEVFFYTAVALYDPCTQLIRQALDTTSVIFRHLTERQIKDYIARDQPLQCAGSFKSESLGIALFEKINSDDPNALVGLPLIKLTGLLLESGVDVLHQ